MTGTCGLPPVNRDSSRISRLAVWARSAWICSTAAANEAASESASASSVSRPSIARSTGNAHNGGGGAFKAQPRERHTSLRQPIDEECRLAQRVGLGRRHHNKLCTAPLQQRIRAILLLAEHAECCIQQLHRSCSSP